MKKFTRFFFLFITSALFLGGQIMAQNIICVDRDFDDDGAVFTDDWPAFQESLDAAGYTYEYWEVIEGENGPSAAEMGEYDIAIWFCGEAWEQDMTLTETDEFELLLYLTLGNGKLFFSGQDYLYDRYPNAGFFEEGEFPYDMLGLVEVVQDIWHIELGEVGYDTCRLVGAPGSLAEGLQFPMLDIYTTEEEDGLYMDSIAQHMGHPLYEVVFPYPSTGTAGIQFETATFRTVFTTASFAAITDVDARNEFMVRIVNWLLYGASGTDELIQKDADMLVYPNPARDHVFVGSTSNIEQLRIISSTGQLVYQENVDNESVRVELGNMPSGMYFVYALTENGAETSRLIINQ